MDYQKKSLLAAVLAITVFATACGGRSLGNNSSDSGISGTGGIVATPSNDTTPPTVTTYAPANASTPAPNTTLVSVTFSEAIDTSTVTASSFHVKSGATCSGTEVSANAAVATNSNQSFTITLTGALTNSTQYSTCLTSAIKDVAGNSLVATQVAWTTTATADVTAPADVTGLAVQPALARLILTWTNPVATDYAAVKIVRKLGSTPADANDGTIACGGEVAAPQTTCTDTGLANGTQYFYKAFSRDAIPNYSSGASGGAQANGTPACGTIEDIRSLNLTPTSTDKYSLQNCTLPQVTVTSVHQDGSNMGFYIQQTRSGAGIFVFTSAVNPSSGLSLAPGDRITFGAGTWTNLCVTAFGRQLQIVRQTNNTCTANTNMLAGDFTEGAADASYLSNLGTTVSGNVTFSTDYTNGADGRLYVFSTPVSVTGAGDASVFPASFGGATTINIAKTALASGNLASGAQFTPGRAVMGRFNDSLELRMYGTGAGGTTNYDGVTAGGGESGFAIKSLSFTTAPSVASSAPAAAGTFGVTSTAVAVTFDQPMTIGTVTTTSLKVVAGTDCSAAALTTTGGVANSNGQKTFTITLNNSQLTSGNTYSTCVSTAVQNSSAIAMATAQTLSWTASDVIYSTGFETGFTKGSYAAAVTGPSGQQWNFDDALMGNTSGSDRYNGTQGVRFNTSNANTNATDCNTNGGMCAEMQFDVYGAQQVRYYCGRYGSETDTNSVQLQSSINGGTSWTNEGAAVVCAGPALSLKSQAVSFAAANVRFRIIKVTGGRLSLDDFEIRATLAPPTVVSANPASGATGVAFGATASVTFSDAMTVVATQGAYTVKETDCSGTTVSTGSPAASGGNTVFTYTLANLKPSTVYAHCVTTAATNASAVAMTAAYNSTFTTSALTEPSGLSFTPGNAQLTIAFTVGNGNGGVQIVRGAAGAAAPADCSSGTAVYNGSTSPQVETALTNGQTYSYRVCSRHNAGAYISAGITGSGTPSAADVTAPANPGSPTYTAGNTQVTLGWTNPADGDFAGIKIVRADATGTAPADCNSGTTVCTGTGCNANVTAGAAGLTYIDTGRTNSTQYAYRMCAYDGVPNMSAGVTGTATPSAGAIAVSTLNTGDIVISEVLYDVATTVGFEGGGGTLCTEATDEFVEIYNKTGNTVNLSGATIQYISSTPTVSTKYTFGSVTIAPNDYLVLVNGTGTGCITTGNLPAGKYVFSNVNMSLSASGATLVFAKNNTAVAIASQSDLYDENTNILDFVGWASPTAKFWEGATAAGDPTDLSIRRKTGVQDTGVNGTDFENGTANGTPGR